MSKTKNLAGAENESAEIVPILLANQKAFRTFLGTRLANEAIVDELLQQSLLKAFERSGSLEAYESVVPWFYKILRNSLIDHYRAHASESEKYARYLADLTGSGSDSVPALDELKAEVCACMTRLLPALKPEYAEVLQRIDLNEEMLDEVARSLQVTPNNLTVRLHRARQALRKNLEQSCGACSEHGCLDCSCG